MLNFHLCLGILIFWGQVKFRFESTLCFQQNGTAGELHVIDSRVSLGIQRPEWCGWSVLKSFNNKKFNLSRNGGGVRPIDSAWRCSQNFANSPGLVILYHMCVCLGMGHPFCLASASQVLMMLLPPCCNVKTIWHCLYFIFYIYL